VNKTEQAVRKIAMALPDVESGVACRGTALECATFTAKKKAFVFMRAVGDSCELRLKLGGKWEKKLVPHDAPPASLEKWIRGSYAALNPAGGRKRTS